MQLRSLQDHLNNQKIQITNLSSFFDHIKPFKKIAKTTEAINQSINPPGINVDVKINTGEISLQGFANTMVHIVYVENNW